ncbi:MAG TPA: PAS domain-containing protein [Jatrophihabitans sp.]|jgi:PAS domain S-box-containing protein
MVDSAPSFPPAQLLAALGQAVIATDLDGRIAYWNPAAERLYGWAAAEVVGRNITEITVPQMSQAIADQVMASLRAGHAWSGCFPVQRRDGSVFPALVTDAGVYTDHSAIGIVGVSSHLGIALQPLLERSSDAALVLTTDAVVTYASPAVDRLFGWQPEDLVGKSLTTFVDPGDHEKLFAILSEPGSPLGDGVELRMQAATGAVTAEAAFTDLRDDPVVHGVICNLRHSERLARLRERERLSAAAHADILQILFGATLELTAAELDPANGHPRVQSANVMVNDALRALRRLLAPDEEPGEPRR